MRQSLSAVAALHAPDPADGAYSAAPDPLAGIGRELPPPLVPHRRSWPFRHRPGPKSEAFSPQRDELDQRRFCYSILTARGGISYVHHAA